MREEPRQKWPPSNRGFWSNFALLSLTGLPARPLARSLACSPESAQSKFQALTLKSGAPNVRRRPSETRDCRPKESNFRPLSAHKETDRAKRRRRRRNDLSLAGISAEYHCARIASATCFSSRRANKLSLAPPSLTFGRAQWLNGRAPLRAKVEAAAAAATRWLLRLSLFSLLRPPARLLARSLALNSAARQKARALQLASIALSLACLLFSRSSSTARSLARSCSGRVQRQQVATMGRRDKFFRRSRLATDRRAGAAAAHKANPLCVSCSREPPREGRRLRLEPAADCASKVCERSQRRRKEEQVFRLEASTIGLPKAS